VRSMLFGLAAVVLASAPFAAQEQARTTMPVLTKEVKPDYTDAAKARKVQGTVEMTVLVQADGTPASDVRIVKSLDPDLDQQAIKAVRQWRFKPGTKDGQPVPVEVNIEMTFTLRDGPKKAEPVRPQVYKPGEEGVKTPVLVRDVKPQYTADAKARGVQGTVEVSAIVKADGTVDEDVRVIRSLDTDLDQQAIIATRQWTFKPGTKDGKPVDVQVNIELTFTLR
jgi:TonB family protein